MKFIFYVIEKINEKNLSGNDMKEYNSRYEIFMTESNLRLEKGSS